MNPNNIYWVAHYNNGGEFSGNYHKINRDKLIAFDFWQQNGQDKKLLLRLNLRDPNLKFFYRLRHQHRQQSGEHNQFHVTGWYRDEKPTIFYVFEDGVVLSEAEWFFSHPVKLFEFE